VVLGYSALLLVLHIRRRRCMYNWPAIDACAGSYSANVIGIWETILAFQLSEVDNHWGHGGEGTSIAFHGYSSVANFHVCVKQNHARTGKGGGVHDNGALASGLGTLIYCSLTFPCCSQTIESCKYNIW
jgi:hypothetical protein